MYVPHYSTAQISTVIIVTFVPAASYASYASSLKQLQLTQFPQAPVVTQANLVADSVDRRAYDVYLDYTESTRKGLNSVNETRRDEKNPKCVMFVEKAKLTPNLSSIIRGPSRGN